MWRALGMAGMAALILAGLPAQVPDVVLTRPGQIAVTAITGEVTLTVAGQSRLAKLNDRVRVDERVATGRKSLGSLTFSNGAVVELGPESEIEVEELLQAPFPYGQKPETMKAEPSVSRTQIRLRRGEVRLAVKPLKAAQGSAFVVVLPAGKARVGEGAFFASVRMAAMGLGVCAVELERGVAEFEPMGGAYAPMPAGRRLAFAVEMDARTGAVTMGEMPKETAPPKP